MWPRAKCPSSCASTASISAGVRRSISVSKKTMRLVRAEAGEVGVAVARARRAVHHEQALGAEAAALEQRLDAPAQVARPRAA